MGSQRKRERKYDQKRDEKIKGHTKCVQQVVDDKEVPINDEENTSQDREEVGTNNQNIFFWHGTFDGIE